MYVAAARLVLLQVLFSTAITAIPSSRARIDRRVSPLRAVQLSTESTVSGPTLHATAGTWKSVIGTFTVPAASELGTDPVSAWVGIDGDTCTTASLQTGVDFTVSDSTVSYDAWYEWYPDYAYEVSGITFSAGDSVTLNVTATSKTAGIATITNNSKGTSASKKITSTEALCEEDAEWLVEVFDSDSVGSPNTSVAFTSAEAVTNTGTVVHPSF